jgi:hypothetical protein
MLPGDLPLDHPMVSTDQISTKSTDVDPYAGIYLGVEGLALANMFLSGLSQSKNVA